MGYSSEKQHGVNVMKFGKNLAHTHPCTDGGEIWHGEVDSSTLNFIPSAQRVVQPQNRPLDTTKYRTKSN